MLALLSSARVALVVLGAAGVAVHAAAQTVPDIAPDGPPIQVPRISGPITLDGRVDEPAWEAIDPLPAVMHLPNFGAPPLIIKYARTLIF